MISELETPLSVLCHVFFPWIQEKKETCVLVQFTFRNSQFFEGHTQLWSITDSDWRIAFLSSLHPSVDFCHRRILTRVHHRYYVQSVLKWLFKTMYDMGNVKIVCPYIEINACRYISYLSIKWHKNFSSVIKT